LSGLIAVLPPKERRVADLNKQNLQLKQKLNSSAKLLLESLLRKDNVDFNQCLNEVIDLTSVVIEGAYEELIFGAGSGGSEGKHIAIPFTEYSHQGYIQTDTLGFSCYLIKVLRLSLLQDGQLRIRLHEIEEKVNGLTTATTARSVTPTTTASTTSSSPPLENAEVTIKSEVTDNIPESESQLPEAEAGTSEKKLILVNNPPESDEDDDREFDILQERISKLEIHLAKLEDKSCTHCNIFGTTAQWYMFGSIILQIAFSLVGLTIVILTHCGKTKAAPRPDGILLTNRRIGKRETERVLNRGRRDRLNPFLD